VITHRKKCPAGMVRVLLLPLLLLLGTAAPLPSAAASARCACVPGVPPPAAIAALSQGNAGFAAELPLLRAAVSAPSDDACGRALWREAFILAASWEGSHEALGRYARADPRRQPYFVVPTPCGAAACIDHKVDWAKNAMLDAEMLVGVAHAAVLAGRHDPAEWFTAEELLGNWAEIAVDRQNNDKVWTYCPTSYNPVAPWRTRTNNMTLLPQLVWVDLPANFTAAAAALNCSFAGSAASAASAAASGTAAPAGAANASCAASVAAVSSAFGDVATATDGLVESLVHGGGSAAVLAAFESAPPPAGTLAGLRTMLQHSQQPEFRRRAGEIWDRMMSVEVPPAAAQ
jgi:hypothetical protein